MNDATNGTEPTLDEALESAVTEQEATAAGLVSLDEPQEPSLDDTLNAAFDAQEQAEAAPEGDDKPETETKEPGETTPEQYKQFHDEVDAALKPWEPAITQQGLTKPQAVQNLVSLYTASVQDPAGFLAGLGQRYAPTVADPAQRAALVQAFARGLGVDIGGGAQPQPNGRTDDTANPLEQRLAQVEQTLQSSQQQQLQATVSRAQAQIKEFTEAKGEDGKPLHPHFEQVKAEMSALMQSGAAKNLAEAYAKAVWTRPDLREQLTKAQQEQQARAAAEERKAGIAKARRAQTPRSASAPAPPEDVSKLSTNDLLEQGWKDLGLDAR